MSKKSNSSKTSRKDVPPSSPSSQRSRSSNGGSSARRQFLPTSTSRPTSVVDLETISFPYFDSDLSSNSISTGNGESKNSLQDSTLTSTSPSTSTAATATQRLSEIKQLDSQSHLISFPTNSNADSNQADDSNSIKSDSSLNRTQRKSSSSTSNNIPSLLSSRMNKPKTSQASISFDNQSNQSTHSDPIITHLAGERRRVSSTTSSLNTKSSFGNETELSTSPSNHLKSEEEADGESNKSGALKSLRAINQPGKAKVGGKSSQGKEQVREVDANGKGKFKALEGEGEGEEEEEIKKESNDKDQKDPPTPSPSDSTSIIKESDSPKQKHVYFEKENEPSLRHRGSKKSKDLSVYQLNYKGQNLTYTPRIILTRHTISSIHPTSSSFQPSSSQPKFQDNRSSNIFQISLTLLTESSFLPSIALNSLKPEVSNSSSLSIRPLEIKLNLNRWNQGLVGGSKIGWVVERGSRVASMVSNFFY